MRWIQEHPRRAVVAFLVAFVVVLAAVGVGGALGGGGGSVAPAQAGEARAASLNREFALARDRAARAQRQVAAVTGHVARWRDRALRAENAAKRAERRAAAQHTNRKSRRHKRR